MINLYIESYFSVVFLFVFIPLIAFIFHYVISLADASLESIEFYIVRVATFDSDYHGPGVEYFFPMAIVDSGLS